MSNKSVTVKIGADTKDFIKELEKADKQINTTQKTANNLEKSLKIEYSDTKLTAAQKQFQKALESTEEQATKLRAKMRDLENSGRVDTEDYSELELCLAKTEQRATTLRTKLEALKDIQIEQLTKKFDVAGKKLISLGQKTSGLSLAATGFLAGGVAMSKSAAATGAEIDDLSQRFDVSAETIQRWQYLAMQGGVDVEVFTKALVKMRAATADIAAGTSNKATESLFALGLDPSKFSSTEEMVNAITSALAAMEDKTLQAAYANEIFGDKIATEMLQYINTGAAELAKWNAEFDAMPILTGEEVESLAGLDDQFNRLTTSIGKASAELGEAFSPIIERGIGWIEEHVIPAIEELAQWFSGLSDSGQDMIIGLLAAVALTSPVFTFFGKMSSKIGGLIKSFSELDKARLKTGLGFAALGAAVGFAFDIMANWGEMTVLERVMKTLGLAALAAAAAMTVFHSSWSVGLAVGAITAAVAAGIGAINAVQKEIYPNEEELSANDLERDFAQDVGDYTVPEYVSGGNTYNESSTHDSYNVTVVIEGSKLSAEEIAEEVSKKIATLAKSRG